MPGARRISFSASRRLAPRPLALPPANMPPTASVPRLPPDPAMMPILATTDKRRARRNATSAKAAASPS